MKDSMPRFPSKISKGVARFGWVLKSWCEQLLTIVPTSPKRSGKVGAWRHHGGRHWLVQPQHLAAGEQPQPI
jgi:hypothetical protein